MLGGLKMKANISKVASLVSDPTRSTILMSLMDGGVHPASELAYFAKVTPQTASFHLSKLLDANIISVEQHGRHRYFKLVDGRVAQLIEQLLILSPETPVHSFKAAREKKVIHYARTCYDHLAGYIGVQMTNSLINQELLKKVDLNYEVTSKGEHFFYNFGIDLNEQQKKRRACARCCLDWSERQHHIAGSLGNAILEKLFEHQWSSANPCH
jgi:DNA-binding transcriptional ArsR family regulator